MRLSVGVPAQLPLHSARRYEVLTDSAMFRFCSKMYRMTEADLRDQMRTVLMRYTPDALKHLPRDRLLAELAETFRDLEVVSFRRVGEQHHSAGGADAARRAAVARERLNAEALEKVAREALTAIMAIVTTRQR